MASLTTPRTHLVAVGEALKQKLNQMSGIEIEIVKSSEHTGEIKDGSWVAGETPGEEAPEYEWLEDEEKEDRDVEGSAEDESGKDEPVRTP